MKKLLILLVAITLTIFALEGLFRAFYPQSGYSITSAPYGWKHKPNTQVTFYGEEPKFGWGQKGTSIVYNSQGLRCYERPTEPDKWFTILVLGDSWVEDMGSRFANLFTTRLYKTLNWTYEFRWNYPIEVVNAGCYGYDNAQELMYYALEGVKYKPNILLIMYAQDTADPKYAEIIGPEYAENVEEKLLLHYQKFTTIQKGYREIAGWLRRNSQLGSFLLTRINRTPIKKLLVKANIKDEDIPITSFEQRGKAHFTEVDKKIWLAFKVITKVQRTTLILFNCMGEFSETESTFLEEHNILHFGWQPVDSDKLREEEREAGIYDPMFESHRFGYKQNEVISNRIIKFLFENNLLPERIIYDKQGT